MFGDGHHARGGVLVLVLIALAMPGTAAAQPPRPPDPPTAQQFEQRVSGELATEGVVLPDLDLRLQIEQVADRWVISLADVTIGKVAASTRIFQLPGERDAAVAALTIVAANLIPEALRWRERRRPPPEPPSPRPPPPTMQSAEQVIQRDFDRQSLRFATVYRVRVDQGVRSVSQRWLVYRGDRALDPQELYRVLGREDLAEAYRRRRITMIGSFVVAGVGLVTASGLLVAHFEASSPSIDRVDTQGSAVWPIWLSLGAALTGAAVGFYLEQNPQPIDEDHARALAGAYNERLRHELAVPPLTVRRSRRVNLALIPCITATTRGLALGARF